MALRPARSERTESASRPLPCLEPRRRRPKSALGRRAAGPELPGRRAIAWIILFLAGLFEVGWAVGLKVSDGFTRLVPSILTGAAMVVSLVLLGLALRTLPLGTAYAVWTGIGTIGTALLGIVLFGESAGAFRLLCIGLIVLGILGLRVSSASA